MSKNSLDSFLESLKADLNTHATSNVHHCPACMDGSAQECKGTGDTVDRLVAMVEAAREFIDAATCNCAPPTFRCGKHRFFDQLDRLAAGGEGAK